VFAFDPTPANVGDTSMLKRLEIIGFKSFADKTAFDFPPGVTAIVGPNGSGKSNVVDSVKWVLGEQSAKSLRGAEMADVIFNGSTSRRSLGMAEVTMTFDNNRRSLSTDAEEVQITRRVYRDGTGEYLINGQVCRLKDVKNLFLGSGAGNDAYSIIEQGRVDVMLQASTKERRTIFEEAAGISRFKARKVETLRRLERVDLNVQRLKDILDEVEKQLRSVKLQAAKAQRYQEYSDRLRALRVGLGLQEYRELVTRLEEEQGVLERLRAELEQHSSQTESWEASSRQLEEAVRKLDEAVHEQESLLSGARQHIAAAEATLTHEGSLSSDLAEQLAASRGRLASLSGRVGALAEAARRAADDLAAVEGESGRQRDDVASLEEALAETMRRLEEWQAQRETDQDEYLEQIRQAGQLQNDVVSLKGALDRLTQERLRCRRQTEKVAENLASLDLELQTLTTADDELQSRLTAALQRQTEHRQERERLGRLLDDTTQLASELRAQRSGLTSRVEVLEGLERSHEGLGTGVREVFDLLEQGGTSWGSVVGMVADLLKVRREYAPLIDLTLGETAQHFLVRNPEVLRQAIQERGQPFSGRVSFLPLAGSSAATRPAPGAEAPVKPARRTPPTALLADPDVVALAERLATCDQPELVDLPAQLLGRTLVVRDLATARDLARRVVGYRLVTMQGEVLEPDGALTVGTHHAETGILSRKSELRELREQLLDLDRRIAEVDEDVLTLRERIAELERGAQELQGTVDVLKEQAADLRSRIGQHRHQREGLHEEVRLSQGEIDRLEEDITAAETRLHQAQQQEVEAKARGEELQARSRETDRQVREVEQRRHALERERTAAKVALGKVEERLTALRAKHQQTEFDLAQRWQERAELREQVVSGEARLAESQRAMLDASTTLASCYLEKEAAERSLTQFSGEREERRRERKELAERIKSVSEAWRTQQEQAHNRELAVNELIHRRTTLVERLREDYQIDLAEEYRKRIETTPPPEATPTPVEEDSPTDAPPTAETFDTAAVNEEIAELRKKLNRLGSVNLDSLQELADLETRAATLQAQYDDLTAARKALEEIINRINTDSRRLFTDTFQTIRTHFQELFRKLFGGGQADIVLEDEVDVLESGIEVIARPPGKELRSISLMSGGEKTMTAVALLLAIFRSKPSPFCILDEVDAALDEANVGRFTAVLRDFMELSQFIIITHSKRTMASADVLYGVTMQESGISKRVAVRFEDWEDESAPPAETAAAG
jgi:chromosome segregation protein